MATGFGRSAEINRRCPVVTLLAISINQKREQREQFYEPKSRFWGHGFRLPSDGVPASSSFQPFLIQRHQQPPNTTTQAK